MSALKQKELVNFTQAARILGISRPTLYGLIAKGHLRPVEIADRSFLSRHEVEALKETLTNKKVNEGAKEEAAEAGHDLSG